MRATHELLLKLRFSSRIIVGLDAHETCTDTDVFHSNTVLTAVSRKILVQKSFRLLQAFPLTVTLIALWIVLSGKLDGFHLSIGIVSAFAISLGTHRLLMLPPAIGPQGVHPFAAHPWLRLLTYLPWLMWQIAVASIHVAFVVLHPRMPIRPCMIRVQAKLPHALARLILANSITMTPGTVTIDVQGDDFLVHALTEASAQGLQPDQVEGTMQQRVANLFPDLQSPPNSGVSG